MHSDSMYSVPKRSAAQANLILSSRPTKRRTAQSAQSSQDSMPISLGILSSTAEKGFNLLSSALSYSLKAMKPDPASQSTPTSVNRSSLLSENAQPPVPSNKQDAPDSDEGEYEEEETIEGSIVDDFPASENPESPQASPVPSTPAPVSAESPLAYEYASTLPPASSIASTRSTPFSVSPGKRPIHGFKRHAHPFKKLHEMEKKARLARELYQLKRSRGYTQDLPTFKGYLTYKEHLERMYANADRKLPPPFSTGPESIAPEPSNAFLRRIVAEARRTLESPRPYIPEFASSSRLAQLNRERDAEIERRLRPQLPSSLPPEDEQIVRQSLSNRGFLAKAAREQVSAQDLSRLRPSQWLNDEIINVYGALISERAAKFEVESAEKNNTPAVNGHSKEQGKSRSTSDDGNPWKVHIFNTFFMSKLQELGYDKARLNKWTKKIDIFGKDLVLIPCNLGNSHWTCAAINFRQKRIEYYDSMGTDRPSIRQALRTYLEKEHMDKKSSPFDFDGWVDYFGEDGPQQENGYDCGVFVCQTMENLSRGVSLPFDFTQKNMSYLRRRMILEITNEKLPLQRP